MAHRGGGKGHPGRGAYCPRWCAVRAGPDRQTSPRLAPPLCGGVGPCGAPGRRKRSPRERALAISAALVYCRDQSRCHWLTVRGPSSACPASGRVNGLVRLLGPSGGRSVVHSHGAAPAGDAHGLCVRVDLPYGPGPAAELLLAWLYLYVAVLGPYGAPGRRNRSPRERALAIVARFGILPGPVPVPVAERAGTKLCAPSIMPG